MRAAIKARTFGRSRFIYEDYLKKSNVNKLKYKIEQVKGVKSCEISYISKSIIVNYDEDFIGNIARGNDLAPQKAATLLRLILTVTNDIEQVQNMFDKY